MLPNPEHYDRVASRWGFFLSLGAFDSPVPGDVWLGFTSLRPWLSTSTYTTGTAESASQVRPFRSQRDCLMVFD